MRRRAASSRLLATALRDSRLSSCFEVEIERLAPLRTSHRLAIVPPGEEYRIAELLVNWEIAVTGPTPKASFVNLARLVPFARLA